jgi:hypothetical protein
MSPLITPPQIESQAGALLVIALLMLLALAARQFIAKPRRRFFRRPYRLYSFDKRQKAIPIDVGQQLHAVMAASFQKQRLLSASEYRVFAVVEQELAVRGDGYRAFAQTNLGEILRTDDENAFHSINSKRVDILVVDRGGWPFLAIEYHGNGHYQGTAAARDAVKKEALRKAGVRYSEISPTDTADQIRVRLREHFDSKVASINRSSSNQSAALSSQKFP